MISIKLKRYDTDKVVPYVLWNFGNFTTNTEGVVLSRAKQFFAMFYICKTETTHAGIASS